MFELSDQEFKVVLTIILHTRKVDCLKQQVKFLSKEIEPKNKTRGKFKTEIIIAEHFERNH